MSDEDSSDDGGGAMYVFIEVLSSSAGVRMREFHKDIDAMVQSKQEKTRQFVFPSIRPFSGVS